MSKRIGSNRMVFFLTTVVETIVGLMILGWVKLVAVAINSGVLTDMFDLNRVLILISLNLGL